MVDEIKIQENTDREDINIVTISDLPSDGAKWYVVHTYSGHENKVATTLKQRVASLGFMDRVFKVLIPTQKKIVVSEGKKREVDEHILPGYVVILMKLSDEVWHLVRSTRGVTGFVGVGTSPTPLPESEIRILMKFMRMEAPKFEARYSVGDGVKIIDGPWKDFMGKVDEVNEEQGRVKVLVSVFERETPMELEFGQVVVL
ncbi:transcription termination/antitermination factor NusG [candidate division WWE3 bacterium CG08_land_8_20_14_0_20_41_10]|uniref:Transcription termination/antitermination protein NusG n=1 Tax=candidate division WWE3 bacterium CG08_land_8_20_14_0_20_41_10 TaxID=1975085 RepID=A0A2H0XCA3_UNCKA|nr:MAG: transcription termination/antitermination factor NusG [candidate division WWE3 bacterium CG08_land_8_20_14_0_20_41_10]